MTLFSRAEKSHSTAVLFDVGSGHIGGALAVLSPNKAPLIVYSTRTPMVFQKHIDFERFLSGMLKTLREVSAELEQKGIPLLAAHGIKKKKINRIQCVFSSPWYISQTRIISFEKQKPFTVSEQFVHDILARAEKKFERSAELQKVRKKLGDSVVIEKHIIQISLNGYQTGKPYNKEARVIEISLFLSMISREVEHKTRAILEKLFHTDDIFFHSFALASFSTIRDIFHSQEDFVLVDVGGEVTDVSLIRKGILLETVSFPTGKHFLLRSVVLDLNTLPEEAHSLIRMHLEKKETEVSSSELEKALSDAGRIWTKSMQHALVEVGDSQLLPRTVFLTADPDFGSWFRTILEKDDFKRFTFTEETFTVATLGEQELYRNIAVASGVHKDPFLALETLFMNKLIHK